MGAVTVTEKVMLWLREHGGDVERSELYAAFPDIKPNTLIQIRKRFRRGKTPKVRAAEILVSPACVMPVPTVTVENVCSEHTFKTQLALILSSPTLRVADRIRVLTLLQSYMEVKGTIKPDIAEADVTSETLAEMILHGRAPPSTHPTP